MADFLISFKSSCGALLQIFLIVATGYTLTRLKIIKSEHIDAISQLVVNITLPFFIFYHTTTEFGKSRIENWWIFPLFGLLITFISLTFGYIFSHFNNLIKEKNEIISLVTFQNSGYLPIPLVAAILPADEASKMFVYIFLFILFFNPLLWSLGVYLLTKETPKTSKRNLVNPPLVVIILSIAASYFGIARFIPDIVLKSANMIGSCTIPLIMIALGGILADICVTCEIKTRPISYVVFLKLFLFPILMLLFLYKFKQIPYLIGLLFVIETAMPPATTLPIIAKIYNANYFFISRCIFFTYIVSAFTVPFFLAFYSMMR